MSQERILMGIIGGMAGIIVGLGFTLMYVNSFGRQDGLVDYAVSEFTSRTDNNNVGVVVGSETPVSSPGSGIPELASAKLIENLNIPWDVKYVEIESKIGILFTERGGTLSFQEINEDFNLVGDVIEIRKINDVRAQGEGGLMGLAVDPAFDENGFIYMCLNSNRGDIRVGRWRLTENLGITDRVNIVTGIPSINSQRHSGCQIEFGPDDNLWIGTGDAATGSFPQNPTNLGGKILRVDRDGNGVAGNLGDPFDERIYSYGHRNVQGLAFFDAGDRPNLAEGEILGVSMEHGPDIDDELNLLQRGNGGWDPVPGYNESVPMTDLEKFPTAFEAIWASGSPTIGASDVAILSGDAWQEWDGAVVVAALAGENITILDFNKNYLQEPEKSTDFDTFGRIRSLELMPDNSLLALTGNGDNEDIIYRLTPN